METKDVLGTISPITHKRLVRLCGLEGSSVRNKVGTIIEAYIEELESNKKEVLENGGKGTPSVHGENGSGTKTGEHKPKTNDGASGGTVEAPREEITWLKT